MLTTLGSLLLLLIFVVHRLALLSIVFVVLLLRDSLLHNLNHILVLQHVRQTAMLRTVLGLVPHTSA